MKINGKSKQGEREQAINLIVDVVPIIHQNDNLLNILNLRFYFNLKLSSCYFSFLFNIFLAPADRRRRRLLTCACLLRNWK